MGRQATITKICLKFLKKKMEKIDKIFKPDNIVSYCESVFKAAMAEVFPESRYIGCSFHFTQALIKKLNVVVVVV